MIFFSINFTDPDYQASPKIEIRQNTRSSAWNGIELVMIESGGIEYPPSSVSYKNFSWLGYRFHSDKRRVQNSTRNETTGHRF